MQDQSKITLIYCFSLIFLVLGLASCAPSKVSQCNQLIQMANKTNEEVKKVSNNGQTSDPQAMIEAADTMEQAAQEMNNLKLTDETLNKHRLGFIKMYSDTATVTRDFVEAFNKKDRPRADGALQKLQQVTKPEVQLVKNVNNYCRSK